MPRKKTITNDISEADLEDILSPELEEDANIVIFKYIHNRCTGVAYYADQKEIEHPVEHCQSCGHPLEELDEDCFVELTPLEKRKLKSSYERR